MSNTIIQIKRSTANAVPQNGALSAAEPAYSYQSDKLFLGTSDGAGVIAIGGKYYVDQQNTIFNIVNSAFTAANTYAVSSNAWTNTVFGYSNTYTQTVGAASNGWANTVVAGANAWTNTVFGYTNSYTQTVGAASNGWANLVASYANTYANNTFLKLTGGTINGDINISGNLTLTGNTVFNNVSTFIVNDPLIYLAGNNYTSDIVDIGFVANYNNGACSTVHTGLFRDAANPNKEWYLFQGYNKEPDNNIIDPNGNNFTIAVLNATLRTSNVILNGANLWSWINDAYTQANAAPGIANSYASTVGAASNGWANTVAAGANAWVNTVFGYTNTSIDAANAWANTSVAGANAWTNTVFGYSNTYTQTVGAASNGWANLVGVAANSYANNVGTAANTNAANASYINTGTLSVLYGGTGAGSFTTNGVIYGNGTGALQVTSAGSDGQVLVSQGGVPQFRHLDGGVF